MPNTYKYLTKSFTVFKYAEVVILNFSVKKGFLKIFGKFTEKQLYQSLRLFAVGLKLH